MESVILAIRHLNKWQRQDESTGPSFPELTGVREGWERGRTYIPMCGWRCNRTCLQRVGFTDGQFDKLHGAKSKNLLLTDQTSNIALGSHQRIVFSGIE